MTTCTKLFVGKTLLDSPNETFGVYNPSRTTNLWFKCLVGSAGHVFACLQVAQDLRGRPRFQAGHPQSGHHAILPLNKKMEIKNYNTHKRPMFSPIYKKEREQNWVPNFIGTFPPPSLCAWSSLRSPDHQSRIIKDKNVTCQMSFTYIRFIS